MEQNKVTSKIINILNGKEAGEKITLFDVVSRRSCVDFEHDISEYLKLPDSETPMPDNMNLYKEFMNCFERSLFKMVLHHCKYNQCKTAKILGISRTTFRTKANKYGLI